MEFCWLIFFHMEKWRFFLDFCWLLLKARDFFGGKQRLDVFFAFSVLVAGICNTWVLRVNNFFADRRVDFLIWQAKTLVF